MFIETLKQLPSEIINNPESKPSLIALSVLCSLLIISVSYRKLVRNG